MPTVENEVVAPGSSTRDDVSVTIRLIATTPVSEDAPGFEGGNDRTILGTYQPTVTDGAWSLALVGNADISPAGTVYEVEERVRGRKPVQYYIDVPSAGGPYWVGDILDDAPASVATAALQSHLDDTVDAHDATAVSVTPTGGIAATTVQAALAELDTEKATVAALAAHEADTTAIHGIADTAALATDAEVTAAIDAHEIDTSAHSGTYVAAAGGAFTGDIEFDADAIFKGRPFLDVTHPDFGVVADGVTNDAAALISAITYAVANNLEVRLPAGDIFTGTTPITTPSTSGGKLRIKGQGKGVTRITRTAGSATNTLTISLTGAAIVELSDFTIVGPTGLAPDNTTRGVDWVHNNTARRFRAARFEITGTHESAMQLSGGGRIELIDCDLAGTDAVVTCFESPDTPEPGLFIARGGRWHTPDGDLSGAGSVGLYIHPHYPYILQGLTIQTLGRYAIYENGTPASPRRVATVTGCTFLDATSAKTSGPTVFSSCGFKGDGGIGSAQLGGRVTFTGCHFEDAGLIGGALGTNTAHIVFDGCQIIGTKVDVTGAAGSTWAVKNCVMVANDQQAQIVTVLHDGTRCVVDNCEATDVSVGSTSPLIKQTVNSTLIVRRLRTLGIRATNSAGVIQATAGTVEVSDCEFDATGGGTVRAINAHNLAAGLLTGRNNKFLGGCVVVDFTGTNNQQRMSRAQGVSPTTIASASSIDMNLNSERNSYDTHVVTGSITINNLTNPWPYTGAVRLVVAAGASWSTSAAGNITPKTTAVRTAGDVVSLLWEPTAAKWLEVDGEPVSAAYTQTYSTADRTLAAYTADSESAAYTGAADGEAKLADLNALRVAYENLRAFTEDVAQMLNAVVDDFQSKGSLG